MAQCRPSPQRPASSAPSRGPQTGHGWLVLIAAINTVISLFYYLRWVGPAFGAVEPGATAMPERWGGAAALTAASASVAVGRGAGVVLAGVTP